MWEKLLGVAFALLALMPGASILHLGPHAERAPEQANAPQKGAPGRTRTSWLHSTVSA